MQEDRRFAAEEGALEQVRRAVRNMREFKRVNRLCGGVRVFVSEDVFAALRRSGGLAADAYGYFELDRCPVRIVHGYPRGYISAE